MSLPNLLTVSRIGLAFGFMLALFAHTFAGTLWALGLFGLAALTDLLDGWLARRWHQESAFGILMDPIADKILVLAALLSFVELALVPAWMVVLIVSREFLITGLRLVAVRQGQVLAAERGGKHKTVSQMVAIVVALGYLVARDVAQAHAAPAIVEAITTWGSRGVWGLMLVTVALTLTSGVSFLWKHRDLFGPR
ncbi:MAG: CDP-diacylglycerol--glycerol-3-phosphate 3-phosphatidyltransferase [Omnitrophica WOR_2 bacterium RIFCSPHIGHO2_02_FULL_68_15]|nr:MAG: CDP-diacylglycerol--glycerol-3-phosphate 3-phosphatidyltransferase [Omnitrophica WOR_2 bacterium RIFCSPHIGHO2_02_FULL_68_15]